MRRKRYSASFKAKVALETIRGLKTTNEIAAEFGVHPTQIDHWNKQALEALPEIFANPVRCQSIVDQNGLNLKRHFC